MDEKLISAIKFAKENPGVLKYIIELVKGGECPINYGLRDHCELDCMDCRIKALETYNGDI